MAKSRKKFRPSLLPSVIVVLMLAVLVSLGSWQINRATQKQRLVSSYEQAPQLATLGLADVDNDWQPYRYRRISLRGKYDNRHQLLLENQINQGRPGYMVMTLFQLADSDNLLMVNRGWVAKAIDASALPDVSVMEATREVAGLINEPPGVGMKMGSLDDSMMGWPKTVPYVDMKWIELQTGKQLLPWIVLLGEEQADGYQRSWQPAVRMGPEKHQGYAFQWFSLAVALLFLFVVGSLRPEGEVAENESDTREK
jgi:surfeit locus 1 family protein